MQNKYCYVCECEKISTDFEGSKSIVCNQCKLELEMTGTQYCGKCNSKLPKQDFAKEKLHVCRTCFQNEMKKVEFDYNYILKEVKLKRLQSFNQMTFEDRVLSPLNHKTRGRCLGYEIEKPSRLIFKSSAGVRKVDARAGDWFVQFQTYECLVLSEIFSNYYEVTK